MILKNAWYHITVAYKLNYQKFAAIKDYLEPDLSASTSSYGNDTGFFTKLLALLGFKRQKMAVNDVSYPIPVRRLHLPVDALRVTIIDGSKIRYEYDLVDKKMAPKA